MKRGIRRVAASCAVVAMMAGCGGGGGSMPSTSQPVFMNPQPAQPLPTMQPAPTMPAAPMSIDATIGTTLPFFRSSFTLGGKPFSFEMIGTDPHAAGVSTTIRTEIVPVRLLFSNGMRFDPTPAVTTIRTSPLFVPATIIPGISEKMQYADAVMRGEWFKFVATKNYHVLLATPIIEPTMQVPVPAIDGSVQGGLGLVHFDWFVNTIEPQLIKQLGLKATTIAIFATDNVKVLEETSNHCCFNGWHGDLHVTTASGPATYLTVWGAILSASPTFVGHVGHELAELLNDPFYTNFVPKWVHPVTGTCSGLNNLIEVGDPVVTDTFVVNGDTFEDAAFFSWFSRDVPSVGVNGRYDLLGRLTKPAAVCV